MNTNYSKIALLLALGAVVGNSQVSALSSNVADFSIRGLNDSTDSLLKIKNASEKMRAADADIEVASAKNAWDILSKDMEGRGIVGRKLDGADTDDLRALKSSLNGLIASDENAKKLLGAIKDFTKNITNDISKIFTATVTSGNAPDAIDINLSAKAEAEKILSKLSSETKFSDLFRISKGILGTLNQTNIDAIKFRTKKTASINNALVTLRGDVFKALSSAPTSVKIGSDTVDLAPLAEKIKLGITTTVANITDQISSLSVISEANGKIIHAKNAQIKAAKSILGRLKFVDGGYDKVLNHIKSKGLDAWFKLFDSAKTTFSATSTVATSAATVANKETAMLTALHTIFGASGAAQGTKSTTLDFTTHNGSHQLAEDSRVTSGELVFAGLGDVDALGASSDDLQLGKLSTGGDANKAKQIFDYAMSPIAQYISNGLNGDISKYTPKSDRDVYFKSMIDATGVSDIPALTKYFDVMSEYELTSFLDQNLEFVQKNKTKPSFAKQKEAIQESLSKIQKSLGEFAADNTKKLLSDNATSASNGIFNGKSKSAIQKVLDNVTDKINAISKEMGDIAPAAQVEKTISNAKNIVDLLAVPSIQNKLNAQMILEIKNNAAVAGEISKITDLATAKETYTKMYNSLVKGTDGKVADADVAALKALFADSVQKDLGVETPREIVNPTPTNIKPSVVKEPKEDGEKEKVNDYADIEDLSADYLSDNGAAAKGEGATEAKKELVDAIKAVANGIQEENKKPAAQRKAFAKAAKEIIDIELKKFDEKYDEKVDGEEGDEKAKAIAVKKATAEITKIVNDAFGIKTSAAQKTGAKKTNPRLERNKRRAKAANPRTKGGAKKRTRGGARGGKTAVRANKRPVRLAKRLAKSAE